MKKLLLTTKVKQVLSVAFLLLSLLFFVLLFALKDKLNAYASKSIQAQAVSGIQKSESAFVDSAYNYSKSGLSYKITFLEFGAIGCSACKRMEGVMAEIRLKYPNHVNVVFKNILLSENHGLMKYFGIAAIPTQVLLNDEGKEFFRHTGYYSAEELIGNLK